MQIPNLTSEYVGATGNQIVLVNFVPIYENMVNTIQQWGTIWETGVYGWGGGCSRSPFAPT